MMTKTLRKTKDNVGVVYLFTNSCYEKEDTYKYGISIQPFTRKQTQKNSTPPTHPFYDRIIMFSPHYKEIEKWLENSFKQNGYLLSGDGGKEWVKADFPKLLDIFKESLKHFPETDLCHNGKRYRMENGTLSVLMLPKCRLDLLRILDGDKIKCIKNGKSFVVRDNKIEDNGSLMPLSNYIKINFPRAGKTNQHNGYMYFTYKGIRIYDMWQSLVRAK